MLEKINETTDFLKSEGFINPVAGIILGTGLGGLTEKMKNTIEIDYKNIPHFPVSTVEGHAGKLIYGDFGGKKIVAMKGRFHYYEGYGNEHVALPVRVLKFLGIKYLFLSNAAGGMNATFRIGDIMIITDHINLLPNPLIGPNDVRIGPRFPDMSQAYDRKLIDWARKAALDHDLTLREGVYACLAGPSFETPADLRFLRLAGADAVGMSTVPEVIVARQGGQKVLGISGISNKANLDGNTITTHEEVLQAGQILVPKLTQLICGVLRLMPSEMV
jgi:purine-nucleoside phosphorylase